MLQFMEDLVKEQMIIIDELYVLEHSRPRPKGQNRLGQGVMCYKQGEFFVSTRNENGDGYSGGILCVWDPRVIRNKVVMGLFDFVIDNWNGEVVIMGDFNEVCTQAERYGSIFNVQCANAFNSFISSTGLEEKNLKVDLAEIDLLLDKGEGDSDILNKRVYVSKSLQDIEKMESMERSQLAVRGILDDGKWIDSPCLVKNEFLSHSKSHFDQPGVSRLHLNIEFHNKLTMDQKTDLECDITRDEIKRAVWDRRIDKSLGPDGFSFGFYHDVVFMGQWSDSNIETIVHVLECFHRASGLRINMNKSKIMRISVAKSIVEQAATKISCAILTVPFSYLGSKVGDLISLSRAWNDIVNKLTARLSKWKMKTLSIGDD
ncbi:hypothetical protein Tco_0981367 [Tanacetum coccineum]